MSKKNKLRACPAAGRPIEAFECALGRHGTYSCPEACEFNHFSVAHYAQYGEIEQSADKKLIDWSADNVADKSQFEAGIESRMFEEPHNSYFHFIARHVFYRTDASGDTCIGKWAKSNFTGLNADERIIMRGRLQTRPAMLEVHRILDDKRIEALIYSIPIGNPSSLSIAASRALPSDSALTGHISIPRRISIGSLARACFSQNCPLSNRRKSLAR